MAHEQITTDPLDQISVRDLFMALRWSDCQELAAALELHPQLDERKIDHLFECACDAARGLNQFYAEQLVAITQAYKQRKN